MKVNDDVNERILLDTGSIDKKIEESFLNLFAGKSYCLDSSALKLNKYLDNFLLRYVSNPKMFEIFSNLHSHSIQTFRHSLNTLLYSYVIGTALECSNYEMNNLCTAAFLHDVGKMKISNDILEKAGKLDEDELRIIREHPSMGYQITSSVLQLNSNIRYGILQHHENYDGSGYPLHAKGRDISFEASIIHAVDIFDAITSKRSYHKPLSYEAAMTYMNTISTSIIAPDIAYVLLKTIHPDMLQLCITISETLDNSFISIGGNHE